MTKTPEEKLIEEMVVAYYDHLPRKGGMRNVLQYLKNNIEAIAMVCPDCGGKGRIVTGFKNEKIEFYRKEPKFISVPFYDDCKSCHTTGVVGRKP